MWGRGRGGGQDGDGPDERTLIARSQDGDVRAFNVLVERHQSVTYALALRLLGEPAAAADVTQDAFLNAFRAIRTFRGASFRAWLLRIVSNGCKDHWRAQARHPSTSLEALTQPDPEEGEGGPAPLDALSDDAWDPERAALRAEMVALIESSLRRLPEEQRLALLLGDVHGLSYEEIAEVMQAPLGTVKSRIARARGHMRDLLRAQGELLPDVYRRTTDHG